MRWIIAAVAAMAVAVLAGVFWTRGQLARWLPAPKIELARREVPGAAFQFPVGKVKEQKLDYEAGRVAVEVARGSKARGDKGFCE